MRATGRNARSSQQTRKAAKPKDENTYAVKTEYQV